MNIYKHGRTWWVRWMSGGKRHQVNTHCTAKAEAKRFADSVISATRAPTFEAAVECLRLIYGERETAIALSAAWAEYVKLATSLNKNVSPDSLRRRKGPWDAFERWVTANKAKVTNVQDVTGMVAADYAAALARSKVKTKTAANHIGELSAIWRVLEKSASGIVNPWRNLAPKDTDGVRLEAFTHEQESAILAAAKAEGKDWFPVCVLARHTGLRYGDIATMTWGEVNLAANTLVKRPHKTASHGITVTLPIIAPVRDALVGVLNERTSHDAPHGPDDYVFQLHAHFYGQRGRAAREALAFRKVLDAANIHGNYTFHSWRHTAATRLAEAGADIETRKRILGHTVDDTARRYDHDPHLAETTAAMEAAAAGK